MRNLLEISVTFVSFVQIMLREHTLKECLCCGLGSGDSKVIETFTPLSIQLSNEARLFIALCYPEQINKSLVRANLHCYTTCLRFLDVFANIKS